MSPTLERLLAQYSAALADVWIHECKPHGSARKENLLSDVMEARRKALIAQIETEIREGSKPVASKELVLAADGE